jgi:hypothetical protein
MLNFQHASFRREPYIIGLATEVMDPFRYEECVRAYPDEKRFAHMTGRYEKYSLSERNNPSEYAAVVAQSPWAAFRKYIKSPTFVRDVWDCLDRVGVTLGASEYRSRFEFSSLPGSGGMLWPHTDIPSKVATLIIPMMAPGDWDPAWGGSTDVLVPKPGVVAKDYQTPLDQFDIVARYPCAPNQAVIFLKWDNSWHSVGPIQGPPGAWRRTLTINIERVPG